MNERSVVNGTNKEYTEERFKKKGPGAKQVPERNKRYGADFKLQVVRKYLEESIPASVIGQECGVCGESVGRWVRAYRREGEAGLSMNNTGRGRSLPSPVRQKIIELKEANPLFGIKRISQLLKRAFFLSTSPETVRKTLHSKALVTPPPKKRQRNITRPRFFERSVPNQMWQTDIFTFRLGGHYAYLIGYIDDYTRYLTGLELFRSQTGQKLEKLTIAADCGIAVHPDQVIAQLQGGTVTGLINALRSKVTVKDGASSSRTLTPSRSRALMRCLRSRCC